MGGDPLINRDSKAILNIIYSEYKQAGATVQIHPDDLARVAENLQDHLNGVSDSFYNEHRLLHADGSWSWVASRAKVTSRDALGCPLRMIGMNADITERKLAHMVFQNASEAIMITDADNQIVSVNPAFTRISGYSLREVLGRNPKKFSSSRQSEKTYQTIFQSLNTVGNWQGEIWNRRRNGEIYPSWVAINTVFNPDNSVHYRIIQFHDITHKKQDEELIWKQANFDELTGLPNRHMLHERLCGEIKKQRRNRLKMAVIFLDLDHFKEVNDALGHFQGDALLLEASQRIASCVRESDTVARLGGDEFTVILANLNDTSHVQRVTEDILSKLSAPFQLENEMVYVSASIGVTIFPDDGTEVITLLKNADQAMYFAKNQGRNRCCYFTKSMQEASQLKIRLANDLRQGLEKEQFILHYQPIVELGAGHILKAEALLRWAHPLHGIISPASFIPIAEETGLIVEIGNWVFRQAAHQAALWRDTYHIDLQISINKSPVQFRSDRHNPGAWFEYLTELGLTGQSLVVEITEGLLMDNYEVVNNQLLTFRDTGIQVALDDFGTGFSALSYLNKFDIDYIKIDQSFTRNLALGSDELALCEAIIVMAHKLGIKVIAEGIETQNQCDLLLAAGCDYGQGYLFSKPVSAIEFARFLAPPTNK
ncbi:MAG: EAL domain-containing protein [Methylomonas sp.]